LTTEICIAPRLAWFAAGRAVRNRLVTEQGRLGDILRAMSCPRVIVSLACASLVSLSSGCPTGTSDDGGFSTFTTANNDDLGDGDGDTETGGNTGDGDGDGDDTAGPNCGDGMVQMGEQCDLGPENSATGSCTPDCQLAACGDGYVYGEFEECDDGNTINTDDCVMDCKLATCGDGFMQTGVEECDDGNDDESDGCTSTCLPATCGDGVVQEGEQCDDANDVTTDDCPSCQLAYCGDGFIQTGLEECDDGNMLDNDACISVFCEIAFCGDGYVQDGVETCDDANMDDTDACPSCAPAVCGDGFTYEDVEDCDDGNMIDDDGCANDCTSQCGGKFTIDWCLQVGTMDQFTRCESTQNGGNTCINPEIRYGNVEGGIPREHPGNNYQTWCQQLGFTSYSTHQTGARPCLAPQGGLFGCASYDEFVWHWCDWQDGPWYNQQLDWHQCSSSEITSITCIP
jgi:cysteine-rich repeat protein